MTVTRHWTIWVCPECNTAHDSYDAECPLECGAELERIEVAPSTTTPRAVGPSRAWWENVQIRDRATGRELPFSTMDHGTGATFYVDLPAGGQSAASPRLEDTK